MDFENIETRLGRAWNTEGVGIDFDTTLNILQSVQSNIIDEVAWLVEGMHPKSLPDTYSESSDCISRQQVIDLLQVVKKELIKSDHECCDGECNHDDCCGKVEKNCPNYKE